MIYQYEKYVYKTVTIDGVEFTSAFILNNNGGVVKEISKPTADLTSQEQTEVLDIVKLVAEEKYDEYTRCKIYEGISFDSHTFSMSDQAQRNWTTVLTVAINDLLPFPYTVTSQEGDYIFNTKQDYINFAMTAIGAVDNYTAQGRTIKNQIVSATTVEDVINLVKTYEEYVEDHKNKLNSQ